MRTRDCKRAKRRYLRGEAPPERVRCEADGCGRMIVVYVPAKGDGSMRCYTRHKHPNGDWCPLSNREPPSEERAFWENR